MEETSLTSSSGREEISIFVEEKLDDHRDLSSTSSLLPKGAETTSDQNKCPLDVTDEEIVDEFQNLFRLQKRRENTSVLKNPDFSPTIQENSSLTDKSPKERTNSLDTAHRSGDTIVDMSYDVPDDEEQSGKFKTDEDHLPVHTINEKAEWESFNNIIMVKMKGKSELAYYEEYSDLDIKPELCFTEQQDHQDDCLMFNIAKDHGTESTGTLMISSRSLQGCDQVPAKMPAKKELTALGDLGLFSANDILEDDVPYGDVTQEFTAISDTEVAGKSEGLVIEQSPANAELSSKMTPQSETLGPYFKKEAIHSRCSWSQSSIESIVNGHTFSLPLEGDSKKWIEEGTVIGESVTLDNLNQPQQDDLATVIRSHGFNENLTEDNKDRMDKLQPALNWACTTVETDLADGTSVEEVFPLQFSNLVVKINEEPLEDTPIVSD
ncbi:unnamed protein product, partial [Schistocephalus solidus]|uniref:Ankyrin repeat domain-containing protein 31 n=1 Tax=Schistocephalus solidus TaxID=70667 RepID=A0A183S9U2_SCHSO